MTANDPQIRIDVWSDVMCPFCWMGDRLLDDALADFAHRDAVQVRYHSYQLMPDLRADEVVDLNQLLADKKGISAEQAEAMHANLTQRGADLGLDYHFDAVQATNTLRAHRIAHFAASAGVGHALIQRLFRAYFSDGLNVGDPDTLADLAAEVGLDRDEALAAVDSAELDAAVEADIRQAQQIGIQAVPFFVFDGKYAVSGAQPVEMFTQALTKIWEETATPA